jgi:hypothetical protein
MSIHGIMDATHFFLQPFAISYAHGTAASLRRRAVTQGDHAPIVPCDADQEMTAGRALRSSPLFHRPHSPH